MERKIYFYTNEIVRMLHGEYVSPVTCEIDLSNRCQLNCSFCMYKDYLAENRCDLDLDIYKCLFRDFRQAGIESITFTGGGEPLMNNNAVEMIDMAFDQGFDMGLITNGISLDHIPDYLLRGFKFIRVSLDAPDGGIYEKIKGVDYFDKVLQNIVMVQETIGESTALGLSYVVCEDNVWGIKSAKGLAKELGVKYIQFKPAWQNGDVFKYRTTSSDTVYSASRCKAKTNFPCMIAGLVGVIGANGRVYYCCQHRGEKHYEVGDLNDREFNEIWKDRNRIKPKIADCPMCRYMSYVKKFEEIPTMLLEHRRFL